MTDCSGAELRETHSAMVLLTDDRAFKMKKPVDLGFLDFTTLERRADACREELRLNRRLAPDVYLGTATLVDDASRTPIEHVLVMRRLPDAAALSTRVQDGAAVRTDVEAVARQLGRFHAEHPVDPALAQLVASSDALQRLWDGCTAAVRASGLLPADVIGEVEDLSTAYLRGRDPLFRARVAEGFVRDGHGDLQASDVFVLDDGVRLIDCLDFDERLRIGDVAADIAFLAMDLERLGAADLSPLLLEAHAKASGLRTPPSLQDFYISYRAWVRCATGCLRAAQGGPVEGLHVLAALALSHLQAAQPRMVIVSGLPAAGKSTLAGRLAAAHPDWALLRSDVLREARVARGPARYGTGARATVYDAMLREASAALAHGRSVILDATFSEPSWRASALRAARDARARPVVLECVVPFEEALSRLRARAVRGDDPSEATEAALRRLAAEQVPWAGAVRVDTSREIPVDELLRAGDLAIA